MSLRSIGNCKKRRRDILWNCGLWARESRREPQRLVHGSVSNGNWIEKREGLPLVQQAGADKDLKISSKKPKRK